MTTIARRALLGAAALLPARTAPAQQPAFPARPLRLVIGFPPGAAVDAGMRIMARAAQDPLGQPIVIENRPGAGSSIAAGEVARAAPDGYGLFAGTIANAINAALQPNLPFVLGRDLIPVAGVGTLPNILVVHPGLGVRSVADLVAAARAKPEGIFFGSSGIGTSPHLSGELFNLMAGVRLAHVPYAGSPPAVTDLLAGRVQVMFAPASTVRQQIEAGRLVGLASTGAGRSEAALNLPTVAEQGYEGFESSVWFGVMAPGGTPAPVAARIEAAVRVALSLPATLAGFSEQGLLPMPMGPGEFGRLIAAETAKWARVIQAAGVQPN